jgi:hypothetical protein
LPAGLKLAARRGSGKCDSESLMTIKAPNGCNPLLPRRPLSRSLPRKTSTAAVITTVTLTRSTL